MKAFIFTHLGKHPLHTSALIALLLALMMSSVNAQDYERDQMMKIQPTDPYVRSEHSLFATEQQLIVDGDFEGGRYGSTYGRSGVSGPWTWTASLDTSNPINGTNAAYTHSGSWMAYFPLGGSVWGLTDSQLYQTVTIPSGMTASLSFWMMFTGAAGNCLACTGGYPEDRLTVNFTDLNGHALTGFGATFYKADATGFGTWVKHTYDVSAFAGQTVQLLFSVHDAGATMFTIDDVSLLASPAGPPPTTLNLSNGRVQVSVDWKSQYDTTKTTNTAAFPILENDNFAFFYFTGASNPEVFLKVLDFGGGGPLCFVGSLTDYYLKVTFKILRTGQTLVFEKKAGDYVGFVDNGTLRF